MTATEILRDYLDGKDSLISMLSQFIHLNDDACSTEHDIIKGTWLAVADYTSDLITKNELRARLAEITWYKE